ncbi:NAD(P)(+) transhydrogenase (Re/Si-specific) subunit beta, partial [Rhizobium leguminosarum]|uniref:NAD(P)(+) transhydrogenase (Re/Si-specific) subunit beta n=1 Tax=Rhizobium leguminosarum TaxID=384 RepID=UPI003F97F462
ALISIVEFNHFDNAYLSGMWNLNKTVTISQNNGFTGELIIIFAGLIIGSVSFAGSIIAWGKLNGKIKDFSFKGQHIFNLGLLAIILGLATFTIATLP